MIERIIEYSIRTPAVVLILTLGLAVAGIWSLSRTPIDAIPDLSENQVIVFADWMGRSPKEIEEQITYPLSVNLQGLAGVKAIRSSSEFNFSMLNIIFDDSVDFYFARTRVLERLALASAFLPPGVVPYLAPDATALGQVFWYTIEGDGYDLSELRTIQDWFVRYQLNAVPGVAQVSSVGGFAKEYQVDVTPERLRAYNITLGQLMNALASSNLSVGGRVIHKGKAEYLVRSVGWITSLDDIRNTVIETRNGVPIRVGDVATVTVGPQFQRSVLEKDGRQVVGGVVLMRFGENPLEITRRVREKIREIEKGLPPGVRIVPFYDRTPLIEGAIQTVRRTLIEELIVAALAVLLILKHFRSAFIICATLLLAVLASFVMMKLFNIPSNIMSLAGIAISIGILVDQAIVMVENASHYLVRRFGSQPIRGNVTELLIQPCREVGRPIFFSVLIMIVSFLPVFALSGMEGKLFHPLAYTKTFALVGVALISITFVPAAIGLFLRGRLIREEDSAIVRGFIEVYKPVLSFLMPRVRLVSVLFVILCAIGLYLARHTGREFMPPLDEGTILDMPVTAPRISVTQAVDDLKVRDALLRGFPEVESVVGKAGRADTPTDPSPLDMVETIVNLRPKERWPKRMLKFEDAEQLTRFALAELALAKGSALTTQTLVTDSTINKITMNALAQFDATMRHEASSKIAQFEPDLKIEVQSAIAQAILEEIDRANGWIKTPDRESRETLKREIVRLDVPFPLTSRDISSVASTVFETLTKEGWIKDRHSALTASPSLITKIRRFSREVFTGRAWSLEEHLDTVVETQTARMWRSHIRDLNQHLYDLGAAAFAQAVAKEMATELSPKMDLTSTTLHTLQEKLQTRFREKVFLWQKAKADLLQELDTVVRMPGWANIWTQPIINRIDMLATGVRTQVGVKVFGRSVEQIESVSRQVVDVLRNIPGAVDVVADQNVGKGYVEIEVDRERAARYGVSINDIQDVIEVALGGKPLTTVIDGRNRYPLRLRYARDYRDDEASLRNILIPAKGTSSSGATLPAGSVPSTGMTNPSDPTMRSDSPGGNSAASMNEGSSAGPREVMPQVTGGGAMPTSSLGPSVTLGDVADVRIVEGPVMIKSENGLLRSYVQLNVRGRDLVGFVEEAKRVVEERVKLPEGAYLEWSGQFEHQLRARKTLQIVFPTVLLLIFVILYITYRDFGDAVLMMLAVPGALAGGVLFQTLFGFNFSVAVWVGYIACFGMATETGIIMLVYLRDAIEQRGGLAAIRSPEELSKSVLEGAVHRLRPKLLTEATAIIGLAPMLWAHGVGAEVIRPMAAPVLGGLLVADEVIDLFLPVLFYHLRLWRWKKLRDAGLLHNSSAPQVDERSAF
ncbi:MAG: efflux RND transporter permease subunit [Candidatus Hydrogenedentota bacterium]|nr:MAG: efflux RND transporter permease subunit [Candidatus Hydrogenedentota bacterium]GIX45434.1 MAG: hypothetical protein KatS3mg130_1842 [Candidatus Sumerlaea sp.]